MVRLRWKIIVGLGIALAAFAILWWPSGNAAKKAVEETRRSLRQQGYKIDLAEFDFSKPADDRARAAALTSAGQNNMALRYGNHLDLLQPVTSNSALVIWQQDVLPQWISGWDLWRELHEQLNGQQAALDAACNAARAGPIGFSLDATAGNGLLLPHLSALRNLAQTLANRFLVEMHDGHRDAAWANLFAVTRLVTAWEPESVEMSHIVRSTLATIAYWATWQALQADRWDEDRLAGLQRAWEGLDFFKGVAETAAFERASWAAACQLERLKPPTGQPSLIELFRSPRYAWSAVTYYWQKRRYREKGTYVDENALLLHYRDREVELLHALTNSTWAEMRTVPGAIRTVFFKSPYSSAMAAMISSRQIALKYGTSGQGLLARSAEAETRRRLIITAIALERFRSRHGSFPKNLNELRPDLLKNAPVDFMDGKPLRYHLTDDGHYVLYSVGFDCVDDGGVMPPAPRQGSSGSPTFGIPQGIDLVWPRPASAAEVKSRDEEEARQLSLKRAALEEKHEAEEREKEALRQVAVEKLLAQEKARNNASPPSGSATSESIYQGKLLSQILRNETVLGTNQVTLNELLTLKQTITGNEPEVISFEVPISYDALTNIGGVCLLVDTAPRVERESEAGAPQEYKRATNGNCLLAWKVTFDRPGRHFVQAQLLYEDKNERLLEFNGPLISLVSTNICQFDHFYDTFNDRGGTLYARLAESNALYTIEIKSPSGELFRKLTGRTSNGVIKVPWDLKDEHGRKYTNESFDSVFHITLPDSGRSQTIKGP